ncbi:hypothetical protein [Pedobacter hiemivivus]|nr:hypothetical protein [Pedobacter hiemivivus]
MNKVYPFVFLLLLFSIECYSQNSYKLEEITPKSPTASGIQKYGEVPVSLNNGTSSISIELYKLSAGLGDLEIPISLNYYNNGLKTDEIPSSIGLGWDLFWGGVISLTQRGNYDFSEIGSGLYSGKSLYYYQQAGQNLSYVERCDYEEGMVSGRYEGEPDTYSYNFLGHSGNFYFDVDQKIRAYPESDLKFSTVGPGGGSFKIIDNNGNTFYFQQSELSRVTSFQQDPFISPINVPSSIFLTKIETAKGRKVRFTYKETGFETVKKGERLSVTGVRSGGTFGMIPYRSDLDTTKYYLSMTHLLPDSIITDNGYIKFIHSSTGRLDVSKISTGSMSYIMGFKVANYQNNKVSEFEFLQSYFDTDKRLKLTSVREISENKVARNWQFSYYGENLSFPAFYDKGKDHWGYYNGKYNASLLPEAHYKELFTPSSLYQPHQQLGMPNDIRVGDRNADPSYSMRGLLKGIKYPTGGSSILTYEPNQIKVRLYTDITNNRFLSWHLPYDTICAASVMYNVPVFTTNISKTFTITRGKYAYVNASIEQDNYYHDNHSSIWIYGPEASANEISYAMYPTGTSVPKRVYLSPGEYRVQLNAGYTFDEYDRLVPLEASFELLTEDPDVFPPYFVGGNRIKSITSIGENGKVISGKYYEYVDSLNKVNFEIIPYYEKRYQESVDFGLADYSSATVHVISSDPIVPIVGSVIEYPFVTEYMDSLGLHGKTSYEFDRTRNLSSGNMMPWMTNWISGKILSKKDYVFKDGNYNLVRSIENKYFSSDTLSFKMHPKTLELISFTSGFIPAPMPGACNGDPNRALKITESGLSVCRYYLKESIAKDYYGISNVISVNNISHGSVYHALPTFQTVTESSGGLLKTKTYYSSDYNTTIVSSNEAKGLKQLANLNKLLPIESLLIRTINGIDHVVKGSLMTFKEDRGLADTAYSLSIITPVPLSSFSKSYINSNGVFVKDLRYKADLNFSIYNAYGNVIEQQYTDNMKELYLYGYKGLYPVAKIINAEYIQLSGLINQDYLSGITDDNTLRDYLNTLRTNLPKSQITTYTYSPLVGMTSQTDPKGETIYYEYDSFQRLKCIKDRQGNIVNSYDYHYKPQTN